VSKYYFVATVCYFGMEWMDKSILFQSVMMIVFSSCWLLSSCSLWEKKS